MTATPNRRTTSTTRIAVTGPALRLRRIALLAGIMSVPLLAGCGDDGDGALSKGEFLEEGNAVCSQGNARIEAQSAKIFGGQDGPPELATFTQFLDLVLVEIRRQIDGLDALTPPDELAAQIDTLIASANSDHDQMRTSIEADPMTFAQSDKDPFANTNALAAQIGLTECAK
jgi:hypothetical protein